MAEHRLRTQMFQNLNDVLKEKKKAQETFGSVVKTVLAESGQSLGTFAVMPKSEQQQLLRRMGQEVHAAIRAVVEPLHRDVQAALKTHPAFQVLLSTSTPPPSLDTVRSELQTGEVVPDAQSSVEMRGGHSRFLRFASRPYHVEEVLPNGALALRMLKVLRYRPSARSEEVHEIRTLPDDPRGFGSGRSVKK